MIYYSLSFLLSTFLTNLNKKIINFLHKRKKKELRKNPKLIELRSKFFFECRKSGLVINNIKINIIKASAKFFEFQSIVERQRYHLRIIAKNSAAKCSENKIAIFVNLENTQNTNDFFKNIAVLRC